MKRRDLLMLRTILEQALHFLEPEEQIFREAALRVQRRVGTDGGDDKGDGK